ncbi:MAG: ribose-phosphate diphosphokinase [Chitinophagales bacterium]
MNSEIKLFGGRSSKELAEKIADAYDQPLSEVEVLVFSDGEFQPQLKESVRGHHVFLIQSTTAPSDNIWELLMLIDAAKRASAKYITVIIPYYGYARQDRKDRSRVPIAAKLMANMLVGAGANRLMTMDLHAPQIQGFFDIPVDHLDSSLIFVPYIQSLELPNLAFASPDAGSANRTRLFAQKCGNAGLVICEKYRKKAGEVAGMTVIGDVEGKNVVIVDDIVDSAGTLTSAAKALKEKGAESVRAICTHPVLSGNAYERVENSALTELVVCDTIPLKQKCTKINVLSVAPLFGKSIKRLLENRSISSLFIQKHR